MRWWIWVGAVREPPSGILNRIAHEVVDLGVGKALVGRSLSVYGEITHRKEVIQLPTANRTCEVSAT